LQIYLSVIQKCKNDKTRLKDIQLIARTLYQYIKEYLKKIEKKEISEKDAKIMTTLFYAPIIGKFNKYIENLDYNCDDGNSIKCENENIIISNNKLIIKYSYTKEDNNEIIFVNNKLEFPNPHIYNINLIKKK
jgi:Na+/phosphate symporter